MPWLPPPAGLALPDGELHVWRAPLDLPEAQLQGLLQTLSAEERARADRFCFERDTRRFVASHGALRSILGRYLGADPARLRFSAGPHGKPMLEGGGLCFNMSHSHELALFAIVRGREVGIDLERVRPMSDAEQIAGRFFSPAENAVLRALPAARRHEAFFTCWVRKEAYVKARGDGLLLPLERFSVSFAPGEPACLLHAADDPCAASRWSLHALAPDSGYAAAVAVQGDGLCHKHWVWG